MSSNSSYPDDNNEPPPSPQHPGHYQAPQDTIMIGEDLASHSAGANESSTIVIESDKQEELSPDIGESESVAREAEESISNPTESDRAADEGKPAVDESGPMAFCISPEKYDKYGFRPPKGSELAPYGKVPESLLRRRMKKWHTMLQSWPKWMSSRSKRQKVKERARKGIPNPLRGEAWQVMSGSIASMQENPGLFDKLKQMEPEKKDLDIIYRDLDRTYPTHITFEDEDGRGQDELLWILKAFAVHRPKTGYVQGMGMLVGLMLMHMPMENAFWLLVTVMDKYIPGLFDRDLSQFHIDCGIFSNLLHKRLKKVAKHLDEQMLDPIMYATKWFLCLFTLSLPWDTVLRMWDIFFFEGVQIIFAGALAIMKVLEHDILAQNNPGEIINILNNISPEKSLPDAFLPTLFSQKISRKQLMREHYRQLELWKKKRSGMEP